MTPFFITGLPRSRTAWCANLFTWANSFCYHDGLRGCESLNDLEDKMALNRTEFVGNSDSGLLHVWRPMIQQFPDARWIVTERDPYEAALDFHQWFSEHPYQNMKVELSLPDTLAHFDRLAREREALIRARSYHVNVIEMDEWDELELANKAWHHIFQGTIPFDTARYLMLSDLRINPMSERISLNVPQVTRLLESLPERTGVT